jgi:HK97 family phage major capsid protein
MLDQLKVRGETAANQLRTLVERAAGEDREFTDAEKATAEELQRSITLSEDQAKTLAELDRSIGALGQLTGPTGNPTKTEVVGGKEVQVVERGDNGKQIDGPAELLRSIWATPGDYMHDIIHGYQGDREARERLERAIQNEVTTDVPGLVPEPIVGEVVNIIDASRPLVASLRSYGMPQYGSSFTRPKVVQHTQVDVQSAQKTELASRTFQVDPIQVNKVTLGGAINVAFQVIDWTQPSALNAITTDLADQYAIQTEAAAATLVHTAAVTTNTANAVTVGSGSGADPTAAEWIAGIAEAAAAVYSGCMRLPDAIIVSPDMWAQLIGLTDTTGRPIVAAGSPMNSMGNGAPSTFAGSILGMPLIVSPQLAADTVIVGCRAFAEVYEDRRGALRVVEPKLLGWEIAYYGYFASIVTEAAAFVSMTVAP